MIKLNDNLIFKVISLCGMVIIVIFGTKYFKRKIKKLPNINQTENDIIDINNHDNNDTEEMNNNPDNNKFENESVIIDFEKDEEFINSD